MEYVLSNMRWEYEFTGYRGTQTKQNIQAGIWSGVGSEQYTIYYTTDISFENGNVVFHNPQTLSLNPSTRSSTTKTLTTDKPVYITTWFIDGTTSTPITDLHSIDSGYSEIGEGYKSLFLRRVSRADSRYDILLGVIIPDEFDVVYDDIHYDYQTSTRTTKNFPHVYELGEKLGLESVTDIIKPDHYIQERQTYICLDSSELMDLSYLDTINTDTDFQYGNVAKAEIRFKTYLKEKNNIPILGTNLALMMKSDLFNYDKNKYEWELLGTFNIVSCEQQDDDMYEFIGYDNIYRLEVNCSDFTGKEYELGDKYKWFKFGLQREPYPSSTSYIAISEAKATYSEDIVYTTGVRYSITNDNTMVYPMLDGIERETSLKSIFNGGTSLNNKYIYIPANTSKSLDEYTEDAQITKFIGPYGKYAIYKVISTIYTSEYCLLEVQLLQVTSRETLESTNPNEYPEGLDGDYYYCKFWRPDSTTLIKGGYLTYGDESILQQVLDKYNFTYTINATANIKLYIETETLRTIDTTARDLLSQICQLCCCYAKIDYSGWKQDNNSFTFNFNHILIDLFDNEYSVYGLWTRTMEDEIALDESQTESVWIKDVTNEGTLIGDGTNEMDIGDNDLVRDMFGGNVAYNIWLRATTLKYRPRRCKLISPFISANSGLLQSDIPFKINVGDVILVTDTDLNSVRFYVMSIKIDETGCVIECTGNKERQS